MKAGVKNIGTVFLMTDAQVSDEKFLVLINDLLASGEIADLFPDDEVENIIGGTTHTQLFCKMLSFQNCKEMPWYLCTPVPHSKNDKYFPILGVRNEVKGAGIQDTRENCWKFFIERVRRMLKVVLCFSPVGTTLRVRSRKFPAVVNCTCIDWFHEWPEEALVSVSRRFLEDVELLGVSLLEQFIIICQNFQTCLLQDSLHLILSLICISFDI